MTEEVHERVRGGSRQARLMDVFAGREQLAVISMRQLRDIGQHRSLRGVALDDISATLRERGLQHLPVRLPREQDRHIVAWKPGTPGTELLDRVHWLSKEAGPMGAAARLTEAELSQLYRAALSEYGRVVRSA